MPNNQSADSTQEEDPGRLRKMLNEATAEIRQLKEERAVSNAGLKLSERQVKAVLRDLHDEKKDLTPENVKAIAKDYGWAEEATSTDTSTDTDTTTDPGTTPPQFDPNALTPQQIAMLSMQQAQAGIGGQSGAGTEGEMTPEKFDQLMSGAKTEEEAMALIHAHGPKFGMIDGDLVN